MKKFLITLLTLLSMTWTCSAIQPLTDADLQAAMDYGIAYSDTSKYSDTIFLAPWTIYDSSMKNPYRLSENAVLYSPYLLAALQSKSQYRVNLKPSLPGLRTFLADYEGITVVGSVLNTPMQLTKEDFSIKLLQGTTVLVPYAVELLRFRYLDNKVFVNQVKKRIDALQLEQLRQKDQELKKELAAVKNDQPVNQGTVTGTTELVPLGKTPLTKIGESTMQFYFDNRSFDPAQPYELTISDKYSGSRVFRVNPANIK